jgi:hypothetical protein
MRLQVEMIDHYTLTLFKRPVIVLESMQWPVWPVHKPRGDVELEMALRVHAKSRAACSSR